MPRILCIEASAEICSVAIFKGEDCLSEVINTEAKAAGSQLTLMIEAAAAKAGISFQDLDAIAVAKGPGSYTGLRIAVSTAKGLCFALDKPLIAINTLEALAQTQKGFEGLILPMLDARRNEVYFSGFRGKDFQNVIETQAHILSEGSFTDLDQPILILGPGAAKCPDILTIPFQIVENVVPLAVQMGPIAAAKYHSKIFENLVMFEPFYLKEFVSLGSAK